MKVLVLGGAGYIGSVLVPYLLGKGDTVSVMDNLLYERKRMPEFGCEFIKGDITNINDLLPAIAKVDAVINLAAISNDPASDLKPELTWEINYKANEMIAKLCQSTGKRVIYASSCSVYGFSENGVFTEDSKLGPVTLYAHTKMLSENYFLQKDIDGIVLRFATVYGYSAKPRFDLVVNTMIGASYFHKKIIVNGGDQWRPVVHVKDVAQAIYKSIHAVGPKHRVYNVGSNKQNYKIIDIARLIAKELDNREVIHKKDSVDGRSYKVDFTRIQKDLGFTTKYTIADTVKEFYKAFEKGEITGMEEDEYFRVKYLKKYVYTNSFIRKFIEKNYLLRLVL